MTTTLNASTAGAGGFIATSDNSGSLALQTAGTTAIYVDTSQNVGIGTTSPSGRLHVSAPASTQYGTFDAVTATSAFTNYKVGGTVYGYLGDASGLVTGGTAGDLAVRFSGAMVFSGGANERMRIDSSGNLLVGKTALGSANAGVQIEPAGAVVATRTSELCFVANRLSSDGTLFSFRQDSNEEGTISVSGTTVSYNGGHLARWSQLPDNSKDDTILKGTVLTNLDDMCVWTKDGETLPNEQLNKMKVSDVDGDTNVAGVFVNWTRDEECNSDDMNVAMTGDMIIRIAQGVTVQRGDLLMSAGDGTAKAQGDDIVRAKTIAKVTSNHVTCTYADGSYCVPCVLMAC
jgi:hypothetical protein